MYTEIFHTVPFEGITTMIRNSDHVKVDQLGRTIAPLGKWLKYTDTYNDNNTPILGAIAGQDFIGVDIDNSVLFNGAIQLLTDTEDDNVQLPSYVAMSMPVDANKGGHLLFSYKDTPEYIISTLTQITAMLKGIKVDIQMNNKLIYLATDANTTKKLITQPLTSLEELTPMTSELLVYLMSKLDLADLNNKNTSTLEAPDTYYGYLLSATLTPNIVASLTPRASYPNITRMDDIPKGSATDWMLKVRKKLQIDKTVSEEVFSSTVLYLNSLWSHPRGPSKQVSLDIDRDIHTVEFVYDKDWEQKGLTFPNTLDQTIGVYYSHTHDEFIQHNTVTDDVDLFPTPTKCINSITSIHKNKKRFKAEILLKKAQPITLVDTPEEKPRLSTPDTNKIPIFNLYTPSEGTRLIQTGTPMTAYKEPVAILSFLRHLLPNEENRVRLMKYLAYKHSTYEPSPLYFVFAGVGGAGKGLFVDVILKYLSGEQRLMSEDLQGLTNNFNEHFSTIDYLEIEEAGEGYTKRESAQLVAELKRITGSAYITIEGKGIKKRKTRHYITPIISSNMRTKLITSTSSDDRRLVLLKSPKKLLNEIQNGNIAIDYPSLKHVYDTRDLVQLMREELPHFAHYLSSLERISYKDYTDNNAWKGEEYHDYISSTMSYADRLLQAAEDKNLKDFVDTLHEASVSDEDIDSLFTTSLVGKSARVVIYWTKQTRDAHIVTLQDIVEASPVLSGDPRMMYKAIKERKSFIANEKTIAIQVISFNDVYDRQAETIETSGEETEL